MIGDFWSSRSPLLIAVLFTLCFDSSLGAFSDIC